VSFNLTKIIISLGLYAHINTEINQIHLFQIDANFRVLHLSISQSTWRRGEGQGFLLQVLEMLTIKIWHIGHYSSEEWFGQNDTKPSVGRCDDNDTYRDDDEKEEKKNDKKDDKKDEKKKSVAFKASSSPKGKAKQETSSEDECSSFDELDDEKMALFAKRFGKFMMKKGYRARRKKSSSKNKDEVRRCFKCNSKDHLVVEYPYNSDNDDNKKKSKKKDKKEKKDKMTFKKKKNGGSYTITWDSDASSSNDDSSHDDKTTKKKALASIAIQEKPSLFDTPSCFMAKDTKVQSDDECDEENNKSECENEDDEPTKDEL
jgi:hypothetical protein